MKQFKTEDDLINFVTELSDDFTDEYLTSLELKHQFIVQVVDYAKDCCETEQELLCFIDGYLYNLKKDF